MMIKTSELETIETSSPNDTNRYRLLGEYRGDVLLIEDTQRQLDLVIPAELFTQNSQMLTQFNAADASIISAILQTI